MVVILLVMSSNHTKHKHVRLIVALLVALLLIAGVIFVINTREKEKVCIEPEMTTGRTCPVILWPGPEEQ